ncbi:MAG: response regulator [Gammaproteobacteria bacterium]|jgi:DNA-binding NtrC family response regulator|nr:response regulator [Gammaproteobacteria bacterium]NCF80915.1 response regulator [Pseudomonadota bacterium]
MAKASAQPDTKAAQHGLILIDDDPLIGESLAFVLRDDFDVHLVASRSEARRLLVKMDNMPALALVDLGLPPEPHRPDEGFALIKELLTVNPVMKILVLSGQSEKHNVQHALSLGAADFIAKPCDPQLLKARLDHHLMIMEAEGHGPQERVSDVDLLGESPAMDELRSQITRFADTPFPVLIQGESGTGKELVAQLLHKQSELAAEPFVSVNCAAFTPELLEAQLFGHAKGAFTGATNAKAGFFEDTGTGTLLLDEVGEFPLALQPKLLRVLENGEYYRVGETRPRVAEARVVAATNRDLLEEIRAGNFRHDLYHRLSVLTIDVPPLRQRGGDSLLLMEHFRALYAEKVAPFVLDEPGAQRWSRYTFPGNVRELRNVVIRLGAKYPGASIGLTELEAEFDSQSQVDGESIQELTAGGFRLDEILSSWEQRYIEAALKLADGNLSEAARLLGVNRTTLYSKIQRLKGEPDNDV